MEQNDLDITEEKENYLDELKKLKIFFYLNINDNVFILPIETDYFSINNQLFTLDEVTNLLNQYPNIELFISFINLGCVSSKNLKSITHL